VVENKSNLCQTAIVTVVPSSQPERRLPCCRGDASYASAYEKKRDLPSQEWSFGKVRQSFISLDNRTPDAKARTKLALLASNKTEADLCYLFILRGICRRLNCHRQHYCAEGHRHIRSRDGAPLYGCEHLSPAATQQVSTYHSWAVQKTEGIVLPPPPVHRKKVEKSRSAVTPVDVVAPVATVAVTVVAVAQAAAEVAPVDVVAPVTLVAVPAAETTVGGIDEVAAAVAAAQVAAAVAAVQGAAEVSAAVAAAHTAAAVAAVQGAAKAAAEVAAAVAAAHAAAEVASVVGAAKLAAEVASVVGAAQVATAVAAAQKQISLDIAAVNVSLQPPSKPPELPMMWVLLGLLA